MTRYWGGPPASWTRARWTLPAWSTQTSATVAPGDPVITLLVSAAGDSIVWPSTATTIRLAKLGPLVLPVSQEGHR